MVEERKVTTLDLEIALGETHCEIRRRAKAIGKKMRQGVYTYYSEEEVARITAMDRRIDREFRVFPKKWPNGETRLVCSAYNEYLHSRCHLQLTHYLHLKKTGEWERGVTRIPAGSVIHHRDLDPTNNDPENLQLLTTSEHRKLHDSTDPSRKEKVKQAMRTRWGSKRSEETKRKMAESQKARRAEEKNTRSSL